MPENASLYNEDDNKNKQRTIKNLLNRKDNAEYIAKVVSGCSNSEKHTSSITKYNKKKIYKIAIYTSILFCLSALASGAEYLINKKDGFTYKFLLASVEKPKLDESESVTKTEKTVKSPKIAPILKNTDQDINKQNEITLQLEKLKKEKELLSQELIATKKDYFLLKNSEQQSKKLKEERDRLKKKVSNLNKLVATIKVKKQSVTVKAPNSVDLQETSKEKAALITQLAEMKKNLIAMEEREKRRPELNNKLKEYKEKLKTTQFEKESMVLKVAELNKKLEKIIKEKLDADDLKKQLEAKKSELFSIENKSARSTMSYHYNLGVIYTKNRMYEEALMEYKKALSMNSDDPDIHYNMAILYDDYLYNHKEAANHYKRYLELAPNSTETNQVIQWLKETNKYLE